MLATELIEMVEKVYKDRDGVDVNLKMNSEYAAAKYIIKQIYKVNKNDELVIRTIKEILSNYFWWKNINSLHMIKNHVSREAAIVNKQMKREARQTEIRTNRLESVFQGKEYVTEYTATI